MRKDHNAVLGFVDAVQIIGAERTADNGASLTFRFPVLREHLNPGLTLHGGQQAVFYDICTSWVLYLVRRPGFWPNAGTSRSLTVTYLRPAVEGDVLILECEVCLISGRLLTRVEFG